MAKKLALVAIIGVFIFEFLMWWVFYRPSTEIGVLPKDYVPHIEYAVPDKSDKVFSELEFTSWEQETSDKQKENATLGDGSHWVTATIIGVSHESGMTIYKVNEALYLCTQAKGYINVGDTVTVQIKRIAVRADEQAEKHPSIRRAYMVQFDTANIEMSRV